MDWRKFLNPWATIRQLEAEKAAHVQKIERLWDDLHDAERVAFHKARDHFELRTKDLQGQNQQLLERMANLASLEPRGPFIIKNPQGDPPQ